MKKIWAIGGVLLAGSLLFGGEISLASGGSFDITSRTSFGINIDDPYEYGLAQELTDFKLRLDMVPYQKLSSLVNSPNAVGFVNITFFDLGMEFTPTNAPSSGGGGYNPPGTVSTNRFQTGEFIAGIAKGNWIFQMNAGGNEPFWSPWNNGIQYVNDRVKFTWSYLQSMVDVRRTNRVSTLAAESEVVSQFTQDGSGPTDTFGAEYTGPTIAALYNKEEAYGLNFKFSTQNPYTEKKLSEKNQNGLAAGLDIAIDPAVTKGLRVFGSVAGSYNYGADSASDPIMAGLQLAPVIALNEDITLEPYIGSDIGIKIDENGKTEPLEYEAAVGVTMRWPGEAGWFTDYILNKDGRVFPGMSVAYKVYGSVEDPAADLQHNMKFTLFEPRGDEGVFYGIGSEIIVDVNNVTAEDREIMATVYGDYTKVGVLNGPGSLIPWTTVCFDNVPGSKTGRVNGLKVDLGVKLDGAISNTVIGLSYHSGDLLQTNSVARFGVAKTTVEIKY